MHEKFTHFGELYRHLVRTAPKADFLHHKKEGAWQTYSKKTFLCNIRYLTLAFYEENWQGKQIAIAVSPSAHWLMLDYALMLCGAASVPLFTNISSKNLLFEFLDANIHTAFIEDKNHRELIHQVDSTIEVIYLDDVSGYRSLDDLLTLGEQIDRANPALFRELLSRINAEDVATIVYTSGTLGTPKGVELTHKNLISQIHATAQN